MAKLPMKSIQFPDSDDIYEVVDEQARSDLATTKSNWDRFLTDGSTVPYLIQTYGAKEAFIKFCKKALALDTNLSLNDIVSNFYDNAKTGKIYGSEFYLFATSNVSTGTKTDDNASMVCEPSTNEVAGRDDYKNLALFMCINVNYKWDNATTLEPTITEIQGVTSGFSLTNPNGLVGVLQQSAWVYIYKDATKKYRKYSDTKIDNNYLPLAECVRARDNSVRPWMIHAKYVAGMNANDQLTSASGILPAASCSSSKTHASISHNGQIALWRARGNLYSGECLCDVSFRELMFEIKYARLGNSGLISGCNSFNTMNHPAYPETGVTRILVTTSQGDYYPIGCTLSLGTGNNRADADGHDIVDKCILISKETVSVSDGTYVALNLDSDTGFDTTTEQYIIPEPWISGSCDNVLGNDGSPWNNTDDKNPGMIQGIEFMIGCYEVLGDTVIELADGFRNVYTHRLASEITSGSKGTNPVLQPDKIPMPASAGWNYIQEGGSKPESLIVPTATGSPAGSSNGYRAAVYMEASSTTGLREWLASMYLNNGGYAGVPGLSGGHSLGAASWHVACRASGSGGNRGEYGSI